MAARPAAARTPAIGAAVACAPRPLLVALLAAPLDDAGPAPPLVVTVEKPSVDSKVELSLTIVVTMAEVETVGDAEETTPLMPKRVVWPMTVDTAEPPLLITEVKSLVVTAVGVASEPAVESGPPPGAKNVVPTVVSIVDPSVVMVTTTEVVRVAEPSEPPPAEPATVLAGLDPTVVARGMVIGKSTLAHSFVTHWMMVFASSTVAQDSVEQSWIP